MRSLTRGVLFTAVAANIVLLLVGVVIVPATLDSLAGIGIVIAGVAAQCALLLAARSGPLGLARLGAATAVAFTLAVAFAVGYLTVVVADLAGHPLALDPLVLFVLAAALAGLAASRRTRRLGPAVLAGVWALVLGTALWSAGLMISMYALWGSREEHAFWTRDGAVADFRHSGGHDYAVFILRDLQGAVFFHPLLSVAAGLCCGAIGAMLGLLAAGSRGRGVTLRRS